MRKFFVIFIGLLLTCVTSVIFPIKTQCALAQEDLGTEGAIKEPIKKQLESLELGELEKYYEELNLSESFDSVSLKDLIYNLITGEQTISPTLIVNVITGTIKTNIGSILKLVVTIVLIVAASKISSSLTTENSSGGIVGFVVIIIILSMISALITDSLKGTIDGIRNIQSVVEVVSPILISLLALIGASGSTIIYQPTIVFLVGGVIEFAVYVLSGIVSLYFVLSIIGAITDHIKINKFKSFLSSCFKFSLGAVFTIFVGYLSLNGITASAKDGISIKTAKFALRSYLPLIGGYVSESYEVFRAGSVLIKNSIGVIGVVILFSIIIVKVINLILYSLSFKLTSALIEPFGSNKITEFLSSLGTIFNFLLTTIVCVFMMCFILLVVIISTANVV